SLNIRKIGFTTGGMDIFQQALKDIYGMNFKISLLGSICRNTRVLLEYLTKLGPQGWQNTRVLLEYSGADLKKIISTWGASQGPPHTYYSRIAQEEKGRKTDPPLWL
ncbi:MAG: hypothetical protein Q8877_03360, partial [Sweet potato little leaf phytoplasma]|nr:hypothetical protein [Sweet potato little leaf phytoplasma]